MVQLEEQLRMLPSAVVGVLAEDKQMTGKFKFFFIRWVVNRK